jgi:hypothetical protein
MSPQTRRGDPPRTAPRAPAKRPVRTILSSNVAYIGTLEVDSHLVLIDTTKCLELEVMRPQTRLDAYTSTADCASHSARRPVRPIFCLPKFTYITAVRQSTRSDLYHEFLGARSAACQTRPDTYTSTPNCASHPRQASRTANPLSSKAFLYPRDTLKVASPLALTGTTKLFELEAMRPQTRLDAYTSIANCASRSRQAARYCVLQDSTSSRPHNVERCPRSNTSCAEARGDNRENLRCPSVPMFNRETGTSY